MHARTPFEELLTGLTDEELAMLRAITRRRLNEAVRDNETLAFMLAGDLPPINAELDKRKARHDKSTNH